jgi:2-hydroxychromene-2-carboxylate isomerase
MSELHFYFDYSSPFAYLGSTQVEAAARRHRADLHWHPFLLGALFKTIGTPVVPVAEMAPPKQKLAIKDMYRWAEHYGVPFSFPSRFPMNTVTALRMTLQVPEDAATSFTHAVFRAYWADDRDINDPEVLTAIANDLGLDGAALLEGCQDPAIKQKLRDATDHATEIGLCGAPCYIVKEGDEDGILFWGQDRLAHVERALDGWRPKMG